MTTLRLQVYLARAGVASRRASEDLIRNGLVTVNGEIVTEMGAKVDSEQDHVKVRGKLLHGAEPHRYVLLYKPRGVVSTASDPEGRMTVLDLVKGAKGRLFPVGRLDVQSEGLLLLTNDGELTNALLHPRHWVPRTYHVKIRGRLDEKATKRLEGGIRLAGRKTRAMKVREIRRRESASWVEVIVHEGRQHLVRDALTAVGHPVARLKRMAFGTLGLGGLTPGMSRPLTDAEVNALRKATGREGRERTSKRKGKGPRAPRGRPEAGRT